jgi:hypothetical protein
MTIPVPIGWFTTSIGPAADKKFREAGLEATLVAAIYSNKRRPQKPERKKLPGRTLYQYYNVNTAKRTSFVLITKLAAKGCKKPQKAKCMCFFNKNAENGKV